MASTSWKDLPGTYPVLQIRVNYSSMSRSNNTVTVNGISVSMKVNTSGGWDGYIWTAHAYVGRDGGSSNTVFSNRQVKAASPTAYYGVIYTSSATNKSFSVLSTSTSGFLDAWGWSSYGAGGGVSAWDLNIPDAGNPNIDTKSVSEITTESAKISWTSSNGTNCTFSSMILEYGLTTGYGSTKTGLSADSNYTIPGLDDGKTYHYRLKITNGAGKTDYSNDGTFTTERKPSGFFMLMMGA